MSCNNPDELSDGVAMSEVLHLIAPDFFNEIWLRKIKTDDVTNWRLKVSNLKKILKGILEYNLDVLNIQIQDFQMPDVNAIGAQSDPGEMGRLLQLILGCAVNCEDKQEYIQRIMAMEESVQHVVMNAIQELMTKEIPSRESESDTGEQLRKTMEELNMALEAKDELIQRCHDLDMQVACLLEEKQSLNADNERLNERLNQAEGLDDPTTPAGKRIQQLQIQLEQLQDEMFKLETAKDDLRINLECTTKNYEEMKTKNADLTALVEDARNLKDEVDVLRHTQDQVSKYEATIESYRKKLDELSDLKGQLKLLEEKNTKYVQERIEMEEEKRKAATIKQQLEAYKKQVHELQCQLTEETKRADKSQFEWNRAQEKVMAVQREKERLTAERESLKELNDELSMQLYSGSPNDSGNSCLGDVPNTSQLVGMMSVPPEVKEKLLRLEHENKMLKLSGSNSEGDQAQVLQSLLDDTSARKNELETELRIANQRIMALEAQVEDLQENQQSTDGSSESLELRKMLSEQLQKIHTADSEIQTKNKNLEDLENKLSASSGEIQEFKEQLEKRDAKIKEMEVNYNLYLGKAKNVLQNVYNPHYANEVESLKAQLTEKEKFIEQIQKENNKSQNSRDLEEKLLVSAWYNLGTQLQRQAAEERLKNNCTGQSFLARQRQVHTRKNQTVSLSSVHQNSSSDFLPY